MGIGLRGKTVTKDVAVQQRKPARASGGNQTAAAAPIRLESVGWKSWPFRSTSWQVEAWRHYDRCGELHNAANHISTAASRAIIEIVEKVDGEPGKRATDPKVAALSDQILGGADERPELIRLAILNNFIAGEYYVFVESPDGGHTGADDRWMILSCQQIRPSGGMPKIEIDRPLKYGGGKITHYVAEGRDKARDEELTRQNIGLLTRAWTPHGLLPDHPDSSVRAAIPILLMIEQFDKRTSAQNDSRLAGAGVLLVPDSFDFPHEAEQDPVDAFEARVGDAMGTTLKDPGNARSLVPIIASALPAEDIEKVRWLTFETPLDEQSQGRLDQAIRRLALGLDLPPSLLLGQEDSNHWTGWLVESSTHKIFIAPPLARLCHALTEGWLQPTLKAMGIDPDKYMVWFDLAPLVVRPDRQADMLALWDRGLIQDEIVLEASNVPLSAAHTPETFKRWAVARAIATTPQMLFDPNFGPTIAAQIGIEAPAAAGGMGAIEAGAANEQPPAQRTPAQEALVTGAEMAVLHSLGIAGKKQLTRGVRDQLMNEFAGRTYDLHTAIGVTDFNHALTLLDGTWDLLPQLAARTGVHDRILRDTLQLYAASQMVSGMPHNPDTLVYYLSEGIEAAGHRFCDHTTCRNQAHPGSCAPTPAMAGAS